jgi:hypothetical protein
VRDPQPDPTRLLRGARVAITVAALAASVLVSLAGRHALDVWVIAPISMLVSHAVGLALFALVLRRWVVRRARRGGPAPRPG